VAEQLDFPNLVCSWPGDSGIAPPPDTVIVQPGDSGAGAPPPPTPLTMMDSIVPPSTGGTPGDCTQVGVFSMRTFIAWEPERMSEVVRIVADVGSNGVEAGVPDVMTGLPTNAGSVEPAGRTDPAGRVDPPIPGDTAGGSGGSPGAPGFMGEYLVRDVGSWFAVDGREANAIDATGGSCTADGAAFDWAQFACEAARFQFEFAMRVEPVGVIEPPGPGPEPMPASAQLDEAHAISMAATDVDGVRLTVIAWTPPPLPPVPLPPDSTVAGGPGGSAGGMPPTR
jgi:hypothetical protein